LASVLAVCAFLLTGASSGARAATRAVWSIQPSPNPRNAYVSGLDAVACAPDGTCSAVGWSFKPNHKALRYTLAERWDGTRWSLKSTPRINGAYASSLTGVACPAPNDCIAVGEIYWLDFPWTSALAERWDGRRWSRVPVRRGEGVVGTDFSSVSCAGPSDCTAVGGFSRLDAGFQAPEQPLAEHWNGRSWTVEATPNPQAPDGSWLDGVSCAGPTSCEAVGNYSYDGFPFRESVFALGWDGARWTYQEQPNPGQLPKVYDWGVSCSTGDRCMSVGTWNATKRYHALAERWDGTGWSRDPVPNPRGFQDSELNDVSCPEASTCLAVGHWTKNKRGWGGGLLAELWNGADWTMLAPAEAHQHGASFSGITCASATVCVAVGSQPANGLGSATLVEVYSG
jgi:hypothetical protein